MKKLLYTFLSLILFQTAFSQKTNTVEKDTFLYNFYNGKLKFEYTLDSNESIIRNGIYAFNSNINQTLEKDFIIIEKLNVSGSFSNNKKDKLWVYNINKYYLKNIEIQGSWKQTVNYNLDGELLTYRFNFSDGTPTGAWTLNSNQVTNGVIEKEKKLASLNYRDGILANNFMLDYTIPDFGKTSIKGKVNDEGFVDGDLFLEYELNENLIVERRNYINGFLLNIEKKIKNSDSLILSLEFTDVKDKLNELKLNTNSLNYTISNRGFGIEFDNGYPKKSSQILGQENGNLALQKLFHLFDMCFIEDTICFENPNINFTRRFKFIYPETDDSVQVVLRKELNSYKETLTRFIENPKYIINKQKSDSLSYFYAYINQSLSKIKLIEDVIDKIDNGYFDFLYRPNFYKNGVQGLNKVDSLEYTFNDKNVKKEFKNSIFLNSPENLLINLNSYLLENKKNVDEYIEITNSKIKIFEKQEKIDSIEIEIVHFTKQVDSLYRKYPLLYKDKDIKDMPIAYKIYKSTSTRIIEKKSKEFLSTESYEEKIEIGKKLICYNKVLVENFEEFSKVEDFENWINKKFTIYQKNPFDDRLFESKILGNIEKSGRILHKFYIDEILKANSCASIKENVENLTKLKTQLDNFVKLNDEDVQRLNKALRSESIPSRIERLFYSN